MSRRFVGFIRVMLLLVIASSLFSDRAWAAEDQGGDVWDPRRAEETFRDALDADPTNFDRLMALADLLSYQNGRIDEAIEHYQAALAVRSGDRFARHGLARSLAWAGRSDESIEVFDSLLAENADDSEALFGRGQLARWKGDHVRARRLVLRALEVAPNNVRYREEYGRLQLASGRPAAAMRAAEEVRRLGGEPTELLEHISADAAPTAGVRASVSEETNDFRRAIVTMQSDFLAWRDARLLVEASYARFEDETGDLDRLSLRVDATQPLPLELELFARYALRKPLSDGATHEGGLEISGRPLPLPMVFRLGGSRHSLVDHRHGFEEIEPIQGLGSGGNTLDAIRNKRQSWEGYAGVSVTPLRGSYAYAEFAAGWISDGNRSRNAVAGAGIDLMQWVVQSSTHAINLQYGLYFLDYASEDSEYFSPRNFLVHTPSLAWRWQPLDRIVVGLEAGAPVEPGERVGWLVSGFGQLRIKKSFSVGVRVRHMENASYRTSSATLGAQVTF